MYCNHPVEVFLGDTRTICALTLIFISILSICLHVAFILAVRRLSGWDSDYAFTLLIGMSCCSLIRFVNEIVCDSLSLAYVDFCSNHHLYTSLGAIDIASYLCLILLSVLMTIHRLIYTVFAPMASKLLSPPLAKAIVVLVGICFFALFGLIQQEDVHYHYVPTRLNVDELSESTWLSLRIISSIANYSLGVTHLLVYPVIFIYLWYRKSLSFRRNQELRMTMQVTIFVTIECVYFVYWEFIEQRPPEVGPLMTSAVVELAFYDSIMLPYLLINRRIQKLIVDTITCRRSVKIAANGAHS
ncbi:hypothetical protein Q1695_009379 [Nippostrongylus brasiliensis]|nr:hypothetical protein Q1695_009379 [Nippostrongylus brasiliensis]